MKSYVLVILGSLLFLSSCDNNNSANGNTEIKEVENFIVEYYEVMSSRNWSAYQDFFADKAILTTVWHESSDADPQIFTNTISEFVAQTANGPDSKPIFEEKPLTIEVELKNNLASVWAKYEAKFGSANELVEWEGYDLFSLLKHNDKWYITSITYLSD